MNHVPPQIVLFGGFHNDPGSRREFWRQLRRREALHAAPEFVGVEWNPVLFAKYDACRKRIADELLGKWDFLGERECDELSKTFAWEADAYQEVFPSVERVWLDDGPGREGDSGTAREFADTLLEDLRVAGEAEGAPVPRSLDELIDQVRLRQKRRKDRERAPPSIDERDLWWFDKIRKRASTLQGGGWVAIVVGWAHANPKGLPGNLYDQLNSAEMKVDPIYLGLPHNY
ncbi:MAG TPA: hypothetical protein VFA20_33150 [Myxococcaceae bacterium]|nr:hypothetical protein [Myxococcaceae bacterium]